MLELNEKRIYLGVSTAIISYHFYLYFENCPKRFRIINFVLSKTILIENDAILRLQKTVFNAMKWERRYNTIKYNALTVPRPVSCCTDVAQCKGVIDNIEQNTVKISLAFFDTLFTLDCCFQKIKLFSSRSVGKGLGRQAAQKKQLDKNLWYLEEEKPEETLKKLQRKFFHFIHDKFLDEHMSHYWYIFYMHFIILNEVQASWVLSRRLM